MKHPCRHTLFAPWLWRLGCSLCLAALAGCTAAVTPRGGVTSARVMNVSREYLPPDGGQTIRPPQRMADVTTLWTPLTKEERVRFASSVASAPVSSLASAWLPPSGREVMLDYLYRLTVSQATLTRRVLDRAASYLPMIDEVLAAHGLPPELAALPLVESAFEPRAFSPAGAAGLWQLMPVTARRFGLVVKSDRDDRLDPRKSTEAAARYLRWLYEYFQDWPLALAAYNCGEGAMEGFLRRHDAVSLAELSLAGGAALPAETRRFVPQFVAAATVMADSGLLERTKGPAREARGSSSSPSFNPEVEALPATSGWPSLPPHVPGPLPAMRRLSS